MRNAHSRQRSMASRIRMFRQSRATDDVAKGHELLDIAQRVAAYSLRRIGRDIPRPAADEIAERVAHAVIVEALESSYPDGPLEKFFWRFVNHKLIDEVRKCRTDLNTISARVDVEEVLDASDAPESISALEKMILREQLDALPIRARRALLLRYLCGFKIASSDPNEETVSRILVCSERTARNLTTFATHTLRVALAGSSSIQRSPFRGAKHLERKRT